MFHMDGCGKKTLFPKYFVEAVKTKLAGLRGVSVVIDFTNFEDLCKEVAGEFGEARAMQGEPPNEGERCVTLLEKCCRSTLWNLLNRDIGFGTRSVSKSEPLPFKHEEMGKVFVSKLLALIRKHKVPPELLLNLDETSVQMVYTPVISSDGSILVSQLIVPGLSVGEEEGEAMWQEAEHLKSHRLLVNHSGGRKQWQNQRTFRSLIASIDTYVKSWILNWGVGITAAVLVLDRTSLLPT
eukprot:gb/GECG01007681.1/.p1 GENE.gb/GECG01007681.1/~~gb/GECG01007681.1/.p1  ORF type:complete len:239 (+),score=23.70 gb/GECG01007681.1/:1-717(+)